MVSRLFGFRNSLRPVSLLCCAAFVFAASPAPQALAQACTTTPTSITGIVYSPNGTDPIPNVLVYVPTTAVQPLPSGVSSCAAAAQLVSGNPLVSTTTAADGSFTLTNPGLAGTNVPLVIQAGKWRRQVTIPAVTACTTTSFSTRLPQNHTEGDIPAIAISTGGSDAFECAIRKVGISDSEFTAAGGSGRISLYKGSQTPGVTSDASGTPLPSETVLVSTPATLQSYDMAIFACQGTATNPAAASTTNQQNVVDFANVGGRIFATHFSYVWLDNSTIFAGTANWDLPDKSISTSTTVPIDATIDTTYAEGKVLAQWLFNIGATPTYGQLPLYVAKKDQDSVNPPTQSWATLNDPAYNNPVMQFTFDTPINASTTPTVSATFTNTPAIFEQGDNGDTVAINVTNGSATPADPSLNLSIALPPGLMAQRLTGGTGTGWACNVSTLTCNRTAPLAAGASDPLTLTVNVSSTAPAGQAPLTASIAGGGLSGTNQCGRVLFNEYHVETASTGNKTFPLECEGGTITPQEKFLEFSLYNLSNFVAPVSTDTVVIHGITTLTWPAPAPITYGTALSATQLDATANIPGTFVYSPAAGTVPGVGNITLSVTFTATDSADYPVATATVPLTILPDPTTTTLTNVVTPIFYGQIIADVAVEAVTGNNGVAIDAGSLDFYISGVLVCTLSATNAGACPPPTGVGYNAGSYTVQSTYTGDTNFVTSSSPIYGVVVQPDPTNTTLTSSSTPAIVGQSVTFTATATDAYATAAGTVTFSNGAAVIGAGTVNSAGVATLTTSTLAIGNSSIVACLNASLNFLGSCSPPMVQVVTPAPLATMTVLGSSVNPSIFGTSVTFTAAVAFAPGASPTDPTGSVTFTADGAPIGSAVALDATGTASISISTLSVGTHIIVATYSGGTSPLGGAYLTSSATLSQLVNPTPPVPSFTMAITPAAISVPIGSSASVLVTVAALNGFDQSVTLSCGGLPSESTCVFDNSTIANGNGTARMTVTAAAPHPCGVDTPFGSGSGTWLGMLGAGILIVLMRRRRTLKGIALALALCILPALSGCTTCTDLGTKPAVYSFTVTGTAVVPLTVVAPQTDVQQTTTQTVQMVASI